MMSPSASVYLRWFAAAVFFVPSTTFASSTVPTSSPSTNAGAGSGGGGQSRRDSRPARVDPDRLPSVGSGETMVWKQSGCIKIPKNLTLCRGAGYSQMHLPNLLEHDDIGKVNEQAASWVPLLNLRCHPDTQIFLCSLFAPICHVRPIWPCKKLCLSVRDSCEPPMARYGFPWPEMLRCDRFPSEKPGNLCIGKQKYKRHSKGGDRCSACDQPDTLEGLVDHFCRVDTVIRLNVDQLVLSAPNVKIKGSKIKILKNQNKQNKEDLLKTPIIVDAGAKCTCAPLWNKSKMLDRSSNETQFLVMGVRRNDRLQVTLLQPFNASSPVMTRVMSAIRKDTLCTSGIKLLLQQQQQQQQQQQSTKTKKKSKKETKQKAKTKKKEIKQKLKAQKVHRGAENGTSAATGGKPQNTKKQKPNGKDGDVIRANDKNATENT